MFRQQCFKQYATPFQSLIINQFWFNHRHHMINNNKNYNYNNLIKNNYSYYFINQLNNKNINDQRTRIRPFYKRFSCTSFDLITANYNSTSFFSTNPKNKKNVESKSQFSKFNNNQNKFSLVNNRVKVN